MMDVIDDALVSTPKLWNDRRTTARLLPAARRFKFSRDASLRLGEIIGKCGPELIRSRQFALLPHPITYVQLWINDVISGIGSASRWTSARELDHELGFLVTENIVRVFVRGDSGDSIASGFRYVRGGTTDPRLLKEGEWMMAALLLGSTLHELEDDIEVLNSEWGVQITYDSWPYDNTELMRSAFGEFRTLLAAILVLNQPNLIRTIAMPARRGTAATRMRPYASHSIVEITLGQRQEYVRLLRASCRASPARHEVRGHFVHRGLRRGCVHPWPIAPEGTLWRCPLCGGTRTWRRAHERGDAALGFVTKEYEVDY